MIGNHKWGRNIFGRGIYLACLWTFHYLTPSLPAAVNQWTGSGENNLWSNPTNWSLGELPDATQDVDIPSSGDDGIALDISATVQSLSMGNAWLIIQTNGALYSIDLSFNSFQGNLDNYGVLGTPAGTTATFRIIAVFTNYGTIRVETNAVLAMSTIFSTFQDGSTIDGGGVCRMAGIVSPLTYVLGTIQVDATLEVTNTFLFGGFWTGNGLLRWRAGFAFQGATFGPGFHVELAAQSTDGICTNLGTVRCLGGYNGTLVNQGRFVVETNLTLGSNTTFNTSGTLELRSGTLTVTPACDFSFSGDLTCDLGGMTPGSQFGKGAFSSLGPYAGNLNVVLTNGFVPAAGNSFTVMTYPSGSSVFLSPQLPSLPGGLVWFVDRGATSLSLIVAQPMTMVLPARLADGSFRFSFGGPAASQVMVQATTNLDEPVQWVNLAAVAPFTGTLTFTDAQATSFPQRFYRALLLP